MQITKIQKSNDKIKIHFGDKKIEIFPSTYAEYNLYINKIIDEKEYKNIIESSKIDDFLKFAYKKINEQDRSPKKLEEMLIKKGANSKQCKIVLEKLKKINYLDEDKIIKEIEEKMDFKHYGYNRLIKTLKDKKISEKKIQNVKYNLRREEKEGKLQLEILEKRYKNKNDFMRKKAVYSGLVRLGFEEQLSLELVNKISNSNHIHEINVLKLDYEKYFLKYSIKYQGRELSERITNALLNKGYRIRDINLVKEKR